jgi:hypothetical protein
MFIHRDRWPAIIGGEQEQVLAEAGFRYDFEPGVLVNTKLRKVLSVEEAADRCVEDLREFATSKRNPREVEIVFHQNPPRELRDSLRRRYGWS